MPDLSPIWSLSGLVERPEEVISGRDRYLQALLGFLAGLAFSDEPLVALVWHIAPILLLGFMTYQPDFGDCWAKLDRGKQHRDALQDEFGLGHGPDGIPIAPKLNPIPVSVKFEDESGYHVYRATARPPEGSPVRWALVVGDAVHNFRSALDHVVWQLACHKTGGANLPGVPEDEARKIQFPITDPLPRKVLPEDYKATGALKHVLPAHRACIQWHQPGGGAPDLKFGMRRHPFVRLRELSNTDKHRLLVPLGIGQGYKMAMPLDLFPRHEVEFVDDRLSESTDAWLRKPDAEIMRVKVRPANFQLNMEVAGYIAPHVGFREVTVGHGVEHVDVVSALDAIFMQVLQVVREVEQLF